MSLRLRDMSTWRRIRGGVLGEDILSHYSCGLCHSLAMSLGRRNVSLFVSAGVIVGDRWSAIGTFLLNWDEQFPVVSGYIIHDDSCGAPGAPSPFFRTGAQVLGDRRLDLLVCAEPSFKLEDGGHIVVLPRMPESEESVGFSALKFGGILDLGAGRDVRAGQELALRVSDRPPRN